MRPIAYAEAIRLKDAEIERLKDLLTRAADALAGWTQNNVVAQPLIDELREAAK
jgi:hypothetical protein